MTVCRQHGLEVVNKALLKDLIVIFAFLKRFILFVVSFNVRVQFVKNIDAACMYYILVWYTLKRSS
jgi:Ca2+/Na+ antiporter